ncbi:GyrI-like domain-containing protein [Clostridium formicaceticum]|uniref:AraC family transcriptional regulator n=1 Tax=Clostridium formicaceticum TaxID=1497 RepID=A0AAC9WF76_9CLOT|nr:GyrI-like domain-containing protein [Clostridium formicaceticum]AOY76110.1 AraC family transcriptional regulator [Clostridium formicaceticum]ARE86476.1 Bacterial transcription activator, effector binding domain [Clostridium formicaceticum]
MDYKFELAEKPAQPVLSMRTKTAVENLPQELGKAYGIIIQYLNEIGEKPSEEVAFAAYYNMDMQDLDVEMGFSVAKPLAGKGEIQASEIPAGKQVSYLYKGPYHQMEPVYTAMMAWISKNSYTPTGTAYEFYYNSPMDVAESELLTKIVLPLK